MKVLIISDNQVEDVELMAPMYRLLEAGQDVEVAALKAGPFKGKHGYEINADRAVAEVNPADYDMLLLPGGKAPATLRQDPQVLAAAKHFMDNDKPVAAICHGPQILAAAGVIKNRHITCWPEVAREVKEAGADYEDSEVVVDRNLVSSRRPSDIPAFQREFMKLIS